MPIHYRYRYRPANERPEPPGPHQLVCVTSGARTVVYCPCGATFSGGYSPRPEFNDWLEEHKPHTDLTCTWRPVDPLLN